MAEPAPRRLLFISNGHGEDSIAAAIIRRLPPGLTVDAYPMLGEGRAYAGVCNVVGPRAQLASEGWRNVRGSVVRDFAGGGLKTLLPGIRFARSLAGRYDRVIVVGDLVGVGSAGSPASGTSSGSTSIAPATAGFIRRRSAGSSPEPSATAFCRADTLRLNCRPLASMPAAPVTS